MPRVRDLGGFKVRRALPHGKRQMVGPLHLLRPDGAGAVHRRPGHGRAAASAYRACHRHLSLRRARHASRQRGQRAGDHAGRDEPDDRRARHRALGAHARRRSRQRGRDVRHPELDRAARRGRGDRSRPSSISPPPTCRASRMADFRRASSPARPSASARRSACTPNGSTPRWCSSRAPARRSIPTTRSARSIWSRARSRSPAKPSKARGS